RRAGSTDAALAIVRSDRGKMIMDQIRIVTEDIILTANRRVVQYSEDSRSEANETGLIAVIGSSSLFVLLVLATINIQRGTYRRQELILSLQQSEEKVKEGRDWLQTTLASIGDGVIATDHAGKVTLLNPVAQSLTGWSQQDSAGKPLEEVFVIRNEETDAI